MAKALLTYPEFKEIIVFHDNSDSTNFNKIEQAAEETYLNGLIGGDLVDAIITGSYTSLLTLIKKCLSYHISKEYVENGNILVNKNGIHQRESDYTSSVEYRDKKNKINSIIDKLQQYESQLIAAIVVLDPDEYNDNTIVSAPNKFIITSVGD